MRCSWGLRLAIRFADVLDNRRWFDASDSSLHGAVPSNEGIYTKCPSQRCHPWQRGGLGPLLLVQQVKYGQGAVSSLKASQGSWTETVLYSFRGGTQHEVGLQLEFIWTPFGQNLWHPVRIMATTDFRGARIPIGSLIPDGKMDRNPTSRVWEAWRRGFSVE